MTNNAQLLPLPALDDELYDKFNGMSAQWHEAMIHRYAQSYALACIEAAKPVNVDWLLEAMNEAIGEIDCGAQYTAQEGLRSALATYEAAQGEKK